MPVKASQWNFECANEICNRTGVVLVGKEYLVWIVNNVIVRKHLEEFNSSVQWLSIPLVGSA
ncbi:MAG: hypothetical protein AB1351_03165 [Thermoproteota archaeon]